MPLYWEGLMALFQKSAAGGQQALPAPVFDSSHFVEGRRAGSVVSTVVDVQAANSIHGAFTAAREGVYLVKAHHSVRAGNVLVWRLLHDVGGNPLLWAMDFTSTSFGFRWEQVIYLRRGDRLAWVNLEAMVLNDQNVMSIANWEIVQA